MNHRPEDVVLTGPPASESALRRLGIVASTPPPDGVQVQCHGCEEKVWMGLRQQLTLKEYPKTHVLCFVCCARLQLIRPGSPVRHLGGQSGTYKASDGTFFGPKKK